MLRTHRVAPRGLFLRMLGIQYSLEYSFACDNVGVLMRGWRRRQWRQKWHFHSIITMAMTTTLMTSTTTTEEKTKKETKTTTTMTATTTTAMSRVCFYGRFESLPTATFTSKFDFLCVMGDHSNIIFEWIGMKFMSFRELFRRSFKWDQPYFAGFDHLGAMSNQILKVRSPQNLIFIVIW